MLSRAELIKAELLDQIGRLATDRLPSDLSSKMDGFIWGLYDGVPPNDIIRERPENLYGAAVSFFRFGEKRSESGPKVRVFNPEVDRHGWQSVHTIIEIINDDMPFLVDSVTAILNRGETETRLVIHPIFWVRRDSTGKVATLAASNGETPPSGNHVKSESWMHIKVRAQPESEHSRIQESIERALDDVQLAVEDFQAMRQKCEEAIAEFGSKNIPSANESTEIVEFLKWLNEHHFTHIGYRRCTFVGRPERIELKSDPGGLGILREESRSVFEGFRRSTEGEALRILKANQRSTVHRPVHLDAVILARFDDAGNCIGEHLFIGLFTLEAYSMSPRNIPLLRSKIDRVIDRAGFAPGTHDSKSLQYILETYPRDELFQTNDDELLAIAMGILQLQWRRRVALFVRHDPFDRFISCLVYLPRDRFDTELRLRVQEILEASYRGSVTAYYTHLSDEPLARIHLIVKTPQGLPDIEHDAVERRLLEATRSWQDRLEEALISDHGEELGSAIARKYGDAFPAGYREDFDEVTAVNDIDFVEEAQRTGQLAMNLYRPVESADHELNFKIYSAGRFVALSELMPMLENMGLKVAGEVPYEIRLRDTHQRIWIHDFSMMTEDSVEVDLGRIKNEFHEAFSLIWSGEMDNDGFNKLVVHAGASPRSIKILRAYSKYLRQIQVPFSQAYMERTLRRNGAIARQLADLFAARFEPSSASPDREKELQTGLLEQLEQVKSLDEDRILRLFLNVITNTLRTNFYQCDAQGRYKPYISLKIAPRELEEVPRPRPYREIFVFSPRVEGVHLRFGAVARGGLRWSDRPEDYRTEVLGLVKAQQVKNSVIVPVGSKGGFVVKRPPPTEAGRSAHVDEGVECYKIFISGLLDVTDNLVHGEVHPPRGVARHDGDDPYLVVAADKGTATFSDIANDVSSRYSFWLDDAFASGGSAGYDHKRMGITARGAWESVKRHFREMGKDIQREGFTCVGVGDMSGDVFGNGMLLSKHIRLVGAFNHLHIFIDPDPDPEASYRERKRLFEQPRSSWKDYNSSLISRGGGVFDRNAKSISVSDEMKEKLGLRADKVAPTDLIRALLMANVELLWFGGIGTYIKSSDETHSQVGDRANDAVRVNGNQIAARVIGEGANLGATQRGRIEYSMQGGRCYTDFIDNSAGVDCSDHEVNIKVLLGDVEGAGDMTRKQRDELLESMTDEVAELVLRDNYLQSQTISVTHQLGSHFIDRIYRLMKSLEKGGHLDRSIEFLPDDETVAERQMQGIVFTRPELAVLLSYTKNTLYEELLDSDLPDDPYLTHDLTRYFPQPIAVDYPERVLGHRLRREIAATVLTNEMINRLGLTFVYETKEKTGMPSSEVGRAYIASREILEVRSLWEQIEALDNRVIASTQYAMHAECGRLVDRVTVWLLRQHGIAIDIQERVTSYRAGVHELTESLGEVLSETDRALVEERSRAYVADGVPEALAEKIAQLPILAPACDIVRIAQITERSVRDVARVYFTVGARFGFQWLRRAAGQLPTDRAWDKQAVTAILDDLSSSQAEVTSRVLTDADGASDVTGVIEGWAEQRRPLIVRNDQLLGELEAMPAPDFAMLAVANRQLKGLLAGK